MNMGVLTDNSPPTFVSSILIRPLSVVIESRFKLVEDVASLGLVDAM